MFSKYPKNEVQEEDINNLTFEHLFFRASTGKLIQSLYRFLPNNDRLNLAATSTDAHKLDKVDRVLSQVEFKMRLMEDVLRVLNSDEYVDNLSVHQNPSGFLRLNDVIKFLSPEILAQLPEAHNVRLNFWPGEVYASLGASFAPETKHGHPRPFCSFIVSGGYEHYLYLPSQSPSDPHFQVVKIKSANHERKVVLRDKPEYLSKPLNERIEASQAGYAYFSTRVIHEVVGRIKMAQPDPGALSINVVFKPHSQRASTYKLYFHEYKPENIIEHDEQLNAAKAQETLGVVKKILINRIEELNSSLQLQDALIPSACAAG